jgi:hypothetical protein
LKRDLRQQDLSAFRQRHDARRQVGGKSDDVVLARHLHHRHLADVYADADAQLRRGRLLVAHRLLETHREAHGVGGGGEGGEIAVAGVLEDFRAVERGGGFFEDRVVPAQQIRNMRRTRRGS